MNFIVSSATVAPATFETSNMRANAVRTAKTWLLLIGVAEVSIVVLVNHLGVAELVVVGVLGPISVVQAVLSYVMLLKRFFKSQVLDELVVLLRMHDIAHHLGDHLTHESVV
jgi:hypothetical protein